MDSQSIFISSNHTRIPTIKLSIWIGQLLGSEKAKKQVEALDVITFLVSKARDLVIPYVKSTWRDYALCQNFGCLTCSRLQLYLVICPLFFNAQKIILYQSGKPYYKTLVLSHLWRFCFRSSPSVRITSLDNLI